MGTSKDLIIEVVDVSNAYLYGDIDFPVYMEQATDSPGVPLHPGFVVELLKSIYGLKKAVFIWGFLSSKSLEECGFKRSSVNARLLFKSHDKAYIIIIIFVHDFLFASNSEGMIETFKKNPSDTFDFKLF